MYVYELKNNSGYIGSVHLLVPISLSRESLLKTSVISTASHRIQTILNKKRNDTQLPLVISYGK